MKILNCILGICLVTPAIASSPIKTCKTTMRLQEKSMEAEISFYQDGDKFSSQIHYPGLDQTMAVSDVATVGEFEVRRGLENDGNIESDRYIDSLNQGERYIMHAMMMTQEGLMEDFSDFLSEGEIKNDCSASEAGFSTGIDLKKVRHVKVFEIQGRPGDMAKTAVVEARDERGKLLGSFFGGFLVSPCK